MKYQVNGLLEKNRNAPSLGVAGMMKSSTNEVVSSLFKSSETTDDRLAKDEEIKTAMKNGDKKFMRRQSQMVRFGGRAAAKHAAEDAKKAEKKGKKLAPWQVALMKKSAETVEEAPKPKLKREGSEKRRAGLTTLSAAFKGSLEALMEMLNAATPVGSLSHPPPPPKKNTRTYASTRLVTFFRVRAVAVNNTCAYFMNRSAVQLFCTALTLTSI